MELKEAIKNRRSIRSYTGKKVHWEAIGEILNSGRMAPTAGNLQNMKFIVVLDEEKRKKLAEASFNQFWMQDAPVHIVVCAEPEKATRFYGTRGERLYSTQNCAAAVQNMLLTIESIGMGGCWVGAFDEVKVKQALNIPDSARPQAIITVGYTTEKPKSPKRYKLNDMTFHDGWGNKIIDLGISLREWSTAKNVLSLEGNLKRGEKLFDKHGRHVIDQIREKTKVFADSVSEKAKKKKSEE